MSVFLDYFAKSSKTTTLEEQPSVTWGAATTGNYSPLPGTQTKVTTWEPTGVGDRAYNHHPHVYEYYGHLHLMYSTANTDEEEPGQYVRYQKSIDAGLTWSTPSTLLVSQDDITKGFTSAGRVCIPAAFVVVDNTLYGIVDINDKGASNSSRTGVGVLAVRVNANGTFGTPVWIENVDGSANAPAPIATYPSYSFDSTLRTKVRTFFTDYPKSIPTWYYSVPSSDLFYSRDLFGATEVSEPSAVTLKTGQVLKVWRLLQAGSNTKIAQASNDGGVTYFNTYETEIPDFPSRTKMLQLSSGKIAAIGNNDSTNRSPLFFSLSEDGLAYTASNTYNIDTETSGPVYSGIFKDTGVQYPDAIQLSSGKILVAYSVNKEDMRISIFDEPTIK